MPPSNAKIRSNVHNLAVAIVVSSPAIDALRHAF
jgi:hypothetical protein